MTKLLRDWDRRQHSLRQLTTSRPCICCNETRSRTNVETTGFIATKHLTSWNMVEQDKAKAWPTEGKDDACNMLGALRCCYT